MSNGDSQGVLAELAAHWEAMKPGEALLVDRERLDRIVRALELHPCRGALEQALDRLERVEKFRRREVDTLPPVDACITLLKKRIGQAQGEAPGVSALDPDPRTPMTVRENPFPKPGQRITWTRYRLQHQRPPMTVEPYQASGAIDRVEISGPMDFGIMVRAREDLTGAMDTFNALTHPWTRLDQEPGQ